MVVTNQHHRRVLPQLLLVLMSETYGLVVLTGRAFERAEPSHDGES